MSDVPHDNTDDPDCRPPSILTSPYFVPRSTGVRYDLEKDMIDVLDVFNTFTNTEGTAKSKMSNHSRKLNGISLGKQQYSWDGKMRPRRVLSIRTMAMVLNGMKKSPEAQRIGAVIIKLVGDESPVVEPLAEPPDEPPQDEAITSIVPYNQPVTVSGLLEAAKHTGDQSLLNTVSRDLCKTGMQSINAEADLQAKVVALRHQQVEADEEVIEHQKEAKKRRVDGENRIFLCEQRYAMLLRMGKQEMADDLLREELAIRS